MEKQKLNIQSSLDLLHKNMESKNLRKHCYAVGKVLSELFDYYKQIDRDNKEIGYLTKDQWEIVGILHDADWEKTTDTPDKHVFELLHWLEDFDISQEMLNVIKTHNSKMTNLGEPQTLLEWSLECCDELTGFIVAVALVMPNKKLSEVSVENILKKLKQKEFARAVDRNQILQCEEKVGIKSEEFIRVALKAMQRNSDLLGL